MIKLREMGYSNSVLWIRRQTGPRTVADPCRPVPYNIPLLSTFQTLYKYMHDLWFPQSGKAEEHQSTGYFEEVPAYSPKKYSKEEEEEEEVDEEEVERNEEEVRRRKEEQEEINRNYQAFLNRRNDAPVKASSGKGMREELRRKEEVVVEEDAPPEEEEPPEERMKCPWSMLDRLKEMSDRHNKLLDEFLAEDGYKQNREKQMLLLVLSGEGSLIERERVKKGTVQFEGQVVEQVRSLGGQFNTRGTFKHEVVARVKASRQSFFHIRHFLTKPNTPHKLKRCMIICHVQSTLLSGVEAFVPKQSEFRKLDKALVSACRVALRGRACRRDGDGNVIESMSNKAVLRRYCLLPCLHEARVRRLKMLQQVVKHPDQNELLVAALLSQLKLDEGGRFAQIDRGGEGD